MLLLVSLIGHAGAIQKCSDFITTTASISVFSLSTKALALDKRNGKTWMRCSIGQHWNTKTQQCSGQAKLLSWNGAQKAAQLLAQQSGSNWRLPTIKELSNLVESRCETPAIDLNVFPQTPIGHFWTSTPFINQTHYYWLVQFKFGENHMDKASRLAHVRLVKD